MSVNSSQVCKLSEAMANRPKSGHNKNFHSRFSNMAEKLCLQLNDFQGNAKKAFGHLRGTTDFADVTLDCEDGKQIEAHKVILASSSPFFQRILKGNKHRVTR